MSTTMPITTDGELLRRAQAVGWQTTLVPDVGVRLVPPHTLPSHLANEAALVAAYIQHRLPALLALLNPQVESPSQPNPPH